MKKNIFIIVLSLLLSGCDKSLSSGRPDSSKAPQDLISIDRYVSSVSDTLPYRISGVDQGHKVDFVVSSYPVIASARNQNASLSIYSDIREEFSKKYSVSGFPQAGLFIKKSLAEDPSKKDEVLSFLSSVYSNIDAWVENPGLAKKQMDELRAEEDAQKEKFGRPSKLAYSIQKDRNGLGFLKKENQPEQKEYDTLSKVFDLDRKIDSFSSYYSMECGDDKRQELTFSIASPSGAPSLAFSSFANSDRFITQAPNLRKAEFAKGEKDFLIFDSVNGRKLQGDNYEFVSRITYGNLYVVSLDSSRKEERTEKDYIVSYGEGLIPDLAFKAVYSA